MWKEVFLFLVTVGVAFGATLVHCPEGSTCQFPEEHIKTNSFEFLIKLNPKEYRAIKNLTITDAGIDKINPKLKYLKNLEYLDLSHNNVQISSIPSLPNLKTLKLKGNNLKSINFSGLPQNLEELDISENLLAQIPKDWKSLKALKLLHLNKNPIDCDCYNYNVLNYERILKDSITIPEPATCHLPKKYSGKHIAAVNCTLNDVMLYDEPEAGSGDRDLFEEEEIDTHKIGQLYEEEEDKTDDNTIIDDKNQLPPEDNLLSTAPEVTESEVVEEEGSGNDEGSGFGAIDIPKVPACHVNCTTPRPVGFEDETNASPQPSPYELAKMVFDDINVFKNTEPTVTAAEVTEPVILKENEPKLSRTSDKSDVEIISNNTMTKEMERASVVNENSSAIYVVVGVCLFLAVVFILCFVKKRKNRMSNKNRRELPTGFGEEMKPLSKTMIQPVNEKPVKNSLNIPEHIPLINGQNGKAKEDNLPVLKSFTPLAHPETLGEVDEEDHTKHNVDAREKPVPELLTPQRERVTIRASEIPDSIPKTPVLVHRQRNSDGEIVNTVIPP